MGGYKNENMATKCGKSYGKICCLYRQDGHKGTQLVVLEGENEITMGRQDCNDYVLEESPAVSRKHVLLKKSAAGWLISDAGSSNGVWVNRSQIKIPNHHLLKDGDIVEIGLNRQSNSPGVYRYRFYTQAHIKRKAVDASGDRNVDIPVHAKLPAVGIKPDATLSAEQLRQKMTEQEERLQEEFNRKQQGAEEALKEMGELLSRKAEEQRQLEKRVAQQEVLEQTLEQMRQQLAAKGAEQEQMQRTQAEQQAMVKAEHEAKESALEKALRLKAEEQALLEQRLTQQVMMEDAMAIMQQEYEKLQQTVEENQVQREQKERAMEQMRQELEVKADEQEKLQTIVQEKQAEVHAQQEARQRQEEAAQNLRMALEKEQESLQAQLGTLKTEVEEGKKRQEATKEEIMMNVEGVMEDELVCAICAELVVQASSLNCSHSFCSYCIQRWMLRKKECPNCRKTITSTVPSLVLDNYINKVVTCLSQDLQEHRKMIIIERKAEQEQFEKEQQSDVVVIDDDYPIGALPGQAQAQARVQGQAQALVQVQTQAQARPQAHAQARPQAHAQARPQAHAQARPQAHAQARPQAHAQARPQAHAQARPQAHAQARPQAHAQAQARTQAHAQARHGSTWAQVQGRSSYNDERTQYQLLQIEHYSGNQATTSGTSGQSNSRVRTTHLSQSGSGRYHSRPGRHRHEERDSRSSRDRRY